MATLRKDKVYISPTNSTECRW